MCLRVVEHPNEVHMPVWGAGGTRAHEILDRGKAAGDLMHQSLQRIEPFPGFMPLAFLEAAQLAIIALQLLG